jgi:cytochrome c2
MNRYLFVLISLIFVLFTPSGAAVYKGQKVFIKKCLKCHETGQAFVAEKSIREWKKLMKKKGGPLADLHLDDRKAKASWSYFKSSKYTKKSKHLKDFLVEYAEDSGNAPACD